MPASVPQEFQKPTFTSLIHPSYAHRSGQKTPQYLQKIFDNFLRAYIGHAGKTLPWAQISARECTATPL